VNRRCRDRSRPAAAGPPAEAETWAFDLLPGGLRVVLETIPYVRSVSVGVWVRAGSRHEPRELGGVSHVLEHLLFKGTLRRSARRIAEDVDSIGGLLNGYTSKEYTCYYVKVLDIHLEKALDLLSDLVLHPRLDPDDLAKEKRVILEEIKMCEDSPDELVGDLLAEAVWGDDGLGRPVIGSEEAVSAITPEEVRTYHAEQYRQKAVVVALAGNVEVEEGIRLVRRYFGPMPEGGRLSRGPGPTFTGGYRRRAKSIEQAHVCLGFRGVSMADPAVYDFHLLAGVLGGGSSSRLFQAVREERGLAYSVYAYACPFSDTGFLGLYAGVSPGNLLEVLSLMGREVRDIASGTVTPEELQRAKDQVKAAVLLGLENTANRMSRLGRSLLLLDRIISPDELARRVDAVTAESLAGVARRVLDSDLTGLAVVGPEGLPPEHELRAAFAEGGGC